MYIYVLFQSTPSAWRETRKRTEGCSRRNHFNPLPPHGGRRVVRVTAENRALFQSTPSAWRETNAEMTQNLFVDISIHSLRMEGDPCVSDCIFFIVISIHSLRMEGDNTFQILDDVPENFNPLPPHGGRRAEICLLVFHQIFQSTPSAWRETDLNVSATDAKTFQSTPSAWRETVRTDYYLTVRKKFQSTPSAWRETIP